MQRCGRSRSSSTDSGSSSTVRGVTNDTEFSMRVQHDVQHRIAERHGGCAHLPLRRPSAPMAAAGLRRLRRHRLLPVLLQPQEGAWWWRREGRRRAGVVRRRLGGARRSRPRPTERYTDRSRKVIKSMMRRRVVGKVKYARVICSSG